MTNKQWKILLSESEAAPYHEKLTALADALVKKRSEFTEEDGLGLMGGKVGLALFFFYYARYTMKEEFADIGLELLSEIFDGINNGFSYHTHAGGLAGIGWTVEHLAKVDFLDADTNEILSDLDPYLQKTMNYDMDNKNYDFLHGAVGNGTYFLNRLPDPKAREYLSQLVDRLEEMSETEADGSIKWRSTLNHEENTTGYNLSLSHGMAAIIAFLGKTAELEINKDKSMHLLTGAVNYLLTFKLDREKYISNFPSWIEEGVDLGPSRLAWCYGDLGVAISLLHAARNVNNKEWEKIAVDVLKDSCSRRDIKENTVLDAGLCHGASGIMHIYNRAYQEIGEEIFKETALYWAKVTLDMAVHEDGIAGYKAWHTEKYGGWQAEYGFLEGGAGIGLALIGLLLDVPCGWDRTLFIS